MLDKSAKEIRHITMAEAVSIPPGETAPTKRTQGGSQAAGGFALPRRLIQPRKKTHNTEGDAFNAAEASTAEAIWRVSAGPSGSTKTVACEQGSAFELGRPVVFPDNGVGASN